MNCRTCIHWDDEQALVRNETILHACLLTATDDDGQPLYEEAPSVIVPESPCAAAHYTPEGFHCAGYEARKGAPRG